ncbi:hypothetical protein LTR09_000675 [Extremus antarcticus]|uniref:DSC E3 ubiquitin ligase complex subunit A n=1 Tax=Extremus antarcticus TaxID=702011 RepID=A0AAJ0GK91_9PEZI|nr:hypothetical protein LTR09_000675 [Extremus antarcticus]
MADRRGILVPLVILAFIFLSPDPVRQSRVQPDHHPTLSDIIAEEQRSLSELNNSTYQTDRFSNPDAIGLNLTGLEPERGFSWHPLPIVQSKARRWLGWAVEDGGEDDVSALHLERVPAPVYRNVTGLVHGKWVRSSLETPVAAPNINLTDYATMNPFTGLKTPRPFGRNITGEGGDVRLRLHERPAPLDRPLEIETANATQMSVEVAITDEETGTEYELRVYGVYLPTIGQAILTTTSDKFAGFFALPHLALSGATFEESRRILNESISRSIQRQIDGETESHNPWTPRIEGGSDTPFSLPECEMILYLQQLPSLPRPTASTILTFLERELRFPTGAFLPPAPDIRFAMTAFSPDCGFMIESRGPPDYVPQEGNHLTGPKIEVLYLNGRHHLLFYTLILSLQLALFIRQMREASTPSTRSRLSLYTFAMISLGDGFTTMSFMLISLFIGGLWVNLVATAFVAFMSVSFFGMRFLMDIWLVQAPEREVVRRQEAEEERAREDRFRAAMERFRVERDERVRAAGEASAAIALAARQGAYDTTANSPPSTEQTPAAGQTAPAPPTVNPPSNSTSQPETLPLPATAPRPIDTSQTLPLFMPSDQSGLLPTVEPNLDPNRPLVLPRESFGSLYTRFYLLLLASLFISLNAASWPPLPRKIYFTGLGFFYLSFWLPQIARNVVRNCRKALKWEFVVGQSLLRMVPFGYFFGYGGNVLFAERDYIVVLASQELIGPRWFVAWAPAGWKPPEAWDYHPVLREDEEGGTMPIGASAPDDTAPESPVTGRASIDGKRRGSIASTKAKADDAGRVGSGKRVFDCAICMQTLEVPVVESASAASGPGGARDAGPGGAPYGATAASSLSGPAGLLARRQYMVTPCRHIFHSACLEGWMKYRLQCPVCREGVPAL